jgi:hypothetical protein
MASYFTKGNVSVLYNGPEMTFTAQLDIPLSPMESMAEERIKAALVLSAKPGDEYAFFGAQSHFGLLGLIDNRGVIAVGIRLKNPKTRDDLIGDYFRDAPDDYMRERFSGVYISVAAHVGRDRDHALDLDFGIASAKAWFYYQYNASLLLNFEENAYRLKFGGGFGLGFSACLLGGCLGASAQMCINVEGGRNNAVGWNFVAKAAGNAELHFGGDCGGCNEISVDVDPLDPCVGAKLCGTAWVELKFTEASGVNFNAGVGGNVTPCN